MSEQDMSLRKQRTPQMTELRSLWVDHRCRELPNENPCSEVVKEICAEFHRAIAAHDAELREQIAREIEAHGEDSGVGAYGTYGPPAITVSDAARIARGKES